MTCHFERSEKSLVSIDSLEDSSSRRDVTRNDKEQRVSVSRFSTGAVGHKWVSGSSIVALLPRWKREERV